MRPYSPIPRFVRGENHGSLIRRILREDIDADINRIDLITTTSLRISILDSGHTPQEQIAEGDTAIHVLWQQHEANAQITVADLRNPIAPGDTTWIPAGDPWQLSPDQLVILLSFRSQRLAVPIDPEHGEDQYSGFNRETIAPAPAGVTLSRWKLTGTLTLPPSDRDLILISLYADLAIRFDSGISMVGQGRASVIRPESGEITLVPNGLTYVLVVR